MLSMSRKAMIIMALMLAAATAATAATAFAGEKDHGADTVRVIAKAINTSADAARQANVRTLRIVRNAPTAAFKVPR